MTGFDRKINVHQTEGGRTRVLTSFALLVMSEEKEETKVRKVCDGPLMRIPIVEVTPTLAEEINWYWPDAVWWRVY